jgi:chromatin segregation and condensation protein Rec8/ScpA/Scc1 (kleisin family)
MPLRLFLKAEIIIPEEAITEEEYEEALKDNREALVELLDEDLEGFVEAIGTADLLVDKFDWISKEESERDYAEDFTLH